LLKVAHANFLMSVAMAWFAWMKFVVSLAAKTLIVLKEAIVPKTTQGVRFACLTIRAWQ
jgi:hypothetical protein